MDQQKSTHFVSYDSTEDGELTSFTKPKGPRDVSQPLPLRMKLLNAFSWFILYLLPVGATIGICSLSFVGLYWKDDDQYDFKKWQVILQFPAKVQEILICMSVSAMVLHFFRHVLLHSDGMPMGLLVGAYRIGAIDYLAMPSFRKPVVQSISSLLRPSSETNRPLVSRQMRTLLYAVVLVLAILYTFTVGPATTAVITPTLAWWTIQRPYKQISDIESYISLSYDRLFPLVFNVSDINQDYCLGDNWDDDGCPDGGYDTFWDWANARSIEGSNFNVTESPLFNPTMLNPDSGQTKRDIVLSLNPGPSTSAAISATAHGSVLSLIDAFWHYVQNPLVSDLDTTAVQRPRFLISEDTRMPAVLVQVQCMSYDYAQAVANLISSSPDLYFATDAIYDFSQQQAKNDGSTDSSSIGTSSEWIVPKAAWHTSFIGNQTNVSWIDTQSIKSSSGSTLSSSLGILVTVPTVYEINENGTDWDSQGSLLTPCIIDANWVDTDYTFDPQNTQTLETSLTDTLDTTNSTLPLNVFSKLASNGSVTGPIVLDPAWATALDNGPLTSTSFSQNWTYLEQILGQAIFPEDGTLEQFWSTNDDLSLPDIANEIAITVSAVVADWLSRSTLAGTNFTAITAHNNDGTIDTVVLVDLDADTVTFNAETDNVPADALDGQTEVRFIVQRYGWGYGLVSGEITFAVIVLFFHIALVLLYFIFHLAVHFHVRPDPMFANSPGEMEEVLAAGIHSDRFVSTNNLGGGAGNDWTAFVRVGHQPPDDITEVAQVEREMKPTVGSNTSYSVLHEEVSDGP